MMSSRCGLFDQGVPSAVQEALLRTVNAQIQQQPVYFRKLLAPVVLLDALQQYLPYPPAAGAASSAQHTAGPRRHETKEHQPRAPSQARRVMEDGIQDAQRLCTVRRLLLTAVRTLIAKGSASGSLIEFSDIQAVLRMSAECLDPLQVSEVLELLADITSRYPQAVFDHLVRLGAPLVILSNLHNLYVKLVPGVDTRLAQSATRRMAPAEPSDATSTATHVAVDVTNASDDAMLSPSVGGAGAGFTAASSPQSTATSDAMVTVSRDVPSVTDLPGSISSGAPQSGYTVSRGSSPHLLSARDGDGDPEGSAATGGGGAGGPNGTPRLALPPPILLHAGVSPSRHQRDQGRAAARGQSDNTATQQKQPLIVSPAVLARVTAVRTAAVHALTAFVQSPYPLAQDWRAPASGLCHGLQVMHNGRCHR